MLAGIQDLVGDTSLQDFEQAGLVIGGQFKELQQARCIVGIFGIERRHLQTAGRLAHLAGVEFHQRFVQECQFRDGLLIGLAIIFGEPEIAQ